jgi:hypothetical protein
VRGVPALPRFFPVSYDVDADRARVITAWWQAALQEGERRSFWRGVGLNLVFFVLGIIASMTGVAR